MKNNYFSSYKNHHIRAKIIIIEKDKDLSRAYGLLLNSHPNYHVVETYSSYNNAIKNDNPNVVLLGCEESLDNCISNINKILKARARTDIIVLISPNETKFAIRKVYINKNLCRFSTKTY